MSNPCTDQQGHIPDFELWMLQLAWYHSADCTVKQPSARCSCGLHNLVSRIRQERTDLRAKVVRLEQLAMDRGERR